jgi:hypothetical protein
VRNVLIGARGQRWIGLTCSITSVTPARQGRPALRLLEQPRHVGTVPRGVRLSGTKPRVASSVRVSPGRSCHWRAINPGDQRCLTVTRGRIAPQVRLRIVSNGADSQADSAGSIPVIRSNVKAQVGSTFRTLGLRSFRGLTPCRAISVSVRVP